ncbi:ribonuclease domain-containing protein [Patulibacter defluvii]|uniref:ribonuclease domain-containing protein n=1 Tax=Patulibacter defluvii TaxID=3095358 RepID=UPI002A759341|nr:ribonuclease domain-containing protein [Patulibacter sp. DM4]
MTPIRSRSLLALVVGLALALPLAACGSDDGGDGTTDGATRSGLVGGSGTSSTRGGSTTRIRVPSGAEGLGRVTVAQLPPEGRATLRLIAVGGPFPHRQDGVTFQNRERILPDRPRGYYREYTVRTPGSPTRGARRIVTGRQPAERYYTADHYDSFRLIVGTDRP